MIIKLNNSDKKINVTEKKILIEMLSNPGKTYSRSQIGDYLEYHKKDLLM